VEVDKHGLGHTVKAYCREHAPLLLVVGDDQKKSALRTYFAECDCYCPVLFARLDTDSKKGYEQVAVGVSRNPYSNSGFSFLLKNVLLPKNSQLVVVHVVTEKPEKTPGRDYLASFKPQCKGKPYAIRSALVYARKERTIPGGIITFVRDRKVELMCLSPKPQGGKKLRAGGKIMSTCMESVMSDFMVLKDDRTLQNLEGASGYSAPSPQRFSSRFLVGTRDDGRMELTDEQDEELS